MRATSIPETTRPKVGYYASGVRESRKQRLELIPYCTKILTQQEP